MGFIEEDPAKLDPAALGQCVGPSVHFNSFSSDTGAWAGSILIACKDQQPEDLTMTYSVGDGPVNSVAAQLVVAHESWVVVRFPVVATLTSELQALKYVIAVPKADVNPEANIQLPTKDKTWHIVGYSCNDQRQEPKVGTAAWKKLVELHEVVPIHVLLGTGDQLYNDNVWNGPEIRKWFDIESKEERAKTPLNDAQAHEILSFYFYAYLRFMKFHPMGPAFSTMPQANTWDDHDIFDGWGSYPPYLQGCECFKQVFGYAKQMYLAFQQHTTADLAAGDGFFGAPGCSWLTQMGPEMAVAALDTRTERTRSHILPVERITELTARAQKLPSTVKHLLFVSAVPIAYPEVSMVESSLNFARSLINSNFLVKTGIYNKLMNDFGEPELLDDVVDHWSSHVHTAEKAALLVSLAGLAKAKQMRITLLSGDVHQCAVACISTKDGPPQASDPGFMVQLISSAIGYGPPSDTVVKGVEFHCHNGARPIMKNTLDSAVLAETMGFLFRDGSMGASKRFGNCNNFVELLVVREKGASCLACNFWVRRKNSPDAASSLSRTRLCIPPLLSESEASLADQLRMDVFEAEPASLASKCCFCCG